MTAGLGAAGHHGRSPPRCRRQSPVGSWCQHDAARGCGLHLPLVTALPMLHRSKGERTAGKRAQSYSTRPGCPRDFKEIHHPCSSRHSNQFSTKPLFLNLASRLQMRTHLGDQGSQVRVLSPRFAAYCTAVNVFSLSRSRFQLAGISHFAGTSTHSLIDVLSCKTTLSRATLGGR